MCTSYCFYFPVEIPGYRQSLYFQPFQGVHGGISLRFVCISLKTNDAGHLFICSFATHWSLLNCLFESLAPLKKWRIFFSLSFKSSLYILDTSPLSDMICNFIPVFSLSFHSLNSFFFQRADVFDFDEVQLINVCFYRLDFWCLT